MKETIVHIRLVSGEDTFGKLINETEWSITVDTPMKITELVNPMTGHSQIMLMKFIPWSETQECKFQKLSIISISLVHPEVARFYLNTIAYQEKHIDPHTFHNMKQANQFLAQQLSQENLSFRMAAKFLNVDLDQIDYSKPN